MAKKLQSSLAVEGELPEDGLAAYGDDGDDLMMALARKIVSGDEEEDAETMEEVFAQARDAEAASEEFLVDDGCSTNQTCSKPISSARTTCSVISLSRCCSAPGGALMQNPPLDAKGRELMQKSGLQHAKRALVKNLTLLKRRQVPGPVEHQPSSEMGGPTAVRMNPYLRRVRRQVFEDPDHRLAEIFVHAAPPPPMIAAAISPGFKPREVSGEWGTYALLS